MTYSTSLTKSYKGGYIHSVYDTLLKREKVEYSLPSSPYVWLPAVSWRAAQIRISRSLSNRK